MRHLLAAWVRQEIAQEILACLGSVSAGTVAIPKDAKIVSSSFVPDRFAYFVIFEHASFPACEIGESIDSEDAKWDWLKKNK